MRSASHLRWRPCIWLATGTLVGFILYSLSLVQPISYLYSDEAAPERHIYNPTNSSMHPEYRQYLSAIFKKNRIPFSIENKAASEELYKKVRVICCVMTCPQNLDTKAIHVKNTWGKHCNKLLFFSSETNTTFPTIGLDIGEGREHLTAKSRQALLYVYNQYYNDADWFLKCDDDTYMIVENLRYFLSGEDTKEPIYFGHHFKTIVKQGYYSGGGGYVLSKEALRRLAMNGTGKCREDGGAEDAEIGLCMERLGVKTKNSTDSLGRSRFHCFDLETHLVGGYPDWYYRYDSHGAQKGQKSISDYAISFHYVSPYMMDTMEFLIYHLHPYGIPDDHQDLNVKT